MIDARLILAQARQGSVPATWKIFKIERWDGFIGSLFGSTWRDPDPLIVFTPEVVIQYIDEKTPLAVIEFFNLSKIVLRVDVAPAAWTKSHVWIELHDRNGKKERWPHTNRLGTTAFDNTLIEEIIQYFIEAYTRYTIFHNLEAMEHG